MRPSRSAKSLANEKIQETFTTKHDFDSELDCEDGESDLTSLSEDSEDRGQNNTATRPPQAKRAKLSKSSSPRKGSSPVKPTIRRRKTLSLLPTMPLDVLFEIFGLLSPKDIMNLTKTNRLFRETLLSKAATTVWKTARERLEAPDCPSNMSEPRWAALLFGNSCQTCTAKNIQKVDFFLMRRVCTDCKKKHLIVTSKFKVEYPDVDIGILDLISSTNVGGWAHGHSSNSKFYWDSDITKMIHTLAVYEDAVHKRHKDAKKKLEEFKAERLQQVELHHANAGKYASWTRKLALQRTTMLSDLSEVRKKAIYDKFLELGYTREDISCHNNHAEFDKPGELTERVWQRIRPILEPDILEEKQERIERQFWTIKRSRRKIVNGLYNTYKMSVPPSQWKYLPTTYNICNFEPFQLLIGVDMNTNIAAEDFSQCIQILPELLSAAVDDSKDRLRSIIPATFRPVPTSTSIGIIEPGEIVPHEATSHGQHFHDLNLATSAFRCGHCRKYVIGWDDIATHHCTDPAEGISDNVYFYSGSKQPARKCPSALSFDERSVVAIQSLLQTAGFNNTTTLATQMDLGDLRFSCAGCKPTRKNNESFRIGFDWRAAVTHAMSKAEGSLPNAWNLLSASDTEIVKAKEREQRQLLQRWTCNHCSIYLNRLEYLPAVISHVQTSHGISSPQEPVDFLLFETSRREYNATFPVPLPPKYPLHSAKTAKCLLCASGTASERNRIFNEQGVQSHIKAKHNVQDPKKGVDWSS